MTDYTRLITSEHADKPKFTAMVALVAGVFADATAVTQSLPGSFDLDAAIGAQLDAVGEWVGVSRNISTPISGVYFSLDTAGLGFDQGNWEGPFDPTTGISSLDDDTYRRLIRAKIAANRWDGTAGDAQSIFQSIFPDGETQVFIQDNQDMTMTVGIIGTMPNALFLALLTKGYLPLKPVGVAVDYKIPSVQGDAIFGFDVENSFVAGFDNGAFGVPPDTKQLVPGYLDNTFVLGQSQLL